MTAHRYETRDARNAILDGWTLEIFGRVTPPLQDSLAEAEYSVRGHGLTPGPVVQAALLSSAIAVLPSRAEALPIFLLEAMAAGAAVVATDVGAVPSVVGDSAGLLVEAGNPVLLATALTAVMTSPELRARLGRAARERACSAYAEPVVTALWMKLYRSLLQ